ncbi:MAG TPA: orotidine-5'-phosphate decarboxylase [Candidatus Egerieicola pullicola]|uniref:Orotidine 5'-phosphate decarboxylase n=1 Tax=Candidatus Egerieicola pullicola TaxID=2840775 RepID=A0A9D1AJ77_9FIRM|nr:orotidine-5'-phosphate decarboxylase [Candidatus Egerieicola pullicola]
MSMDRLITRILETKNPSVAGLDPKLSYIPDFIKEEAFAKHGKNLEGAAAALLAFNKGIIDALCDIVPAVKPQCAYYEMLGWQGVKALSDTIAYAQQKGMVVIIDGKRNDIGTTMEAYAAGHLGVTQVEDISLPAFGGDLLTVNGYLGSDGIKPLLKVCQEQNKGIFVLVKTSNPSSGELQDQCIDGKPIYRVMGEFCEQWGEQLPGQYGYSGVGAVVGATYPDQLTELRKALPHTFFLVPGYGAQGGGAEGVAGAFDENGLGAIINSSRGILCAWQKTGAAPEDYAKAAREEALRMKEDLCRVIPPMKAPAEAQ